jgi:ABC-2 type transport system permease protein
VRKVWLIVKREYLTRVRTKAFVFSTVAIPVLLIGYFIFIVALMGRETDKTLRITIVDNAGGLAAPIARDLNEKLPDGQPAFRVSDSFEKPQDEKRVLDGLHEQIIEGQLDAFLLVPEDALTGHEAEFHTRNPGDFTRTGSLRRAVSQAVVERRLEDRGFHADGLAKLLEGASVKLVKVSKQGESEEKGETFLIGFVAAMLLYGTLIIYGVSTMRSVIEEKSTHIVEILASSIRPVHLLAGKILGVAAVGLTQYLIWAISGGLLATYGAAMASSFSRGTPPFSIHVPPLLLVYLVLFFLGGYFLYSSLYAAVGAMVSTEQDAQQLQLPVIAPLILSLVVLNVILRDPNSTASVVLSLIPFFAPILMVFRMALQMPPFWQIALSFLLLTVTTLGAVWLSARIYRVGILMYGKRPSLVELLRWLRYS